MKKIMNTTLLLMLSSVFFVACQKESDDPVAPAAPSTAAGFWTGKIGAGTTMGLNYAIWLKPDGTMRAYNMASNVNDTAAASSKGNGTWQVIGVQVKMNYSFGSIQYTGTGTPNSNFTGMDGTWTSNTAFAGNFAVNKKS